MILKNARHELFARQVADGVPQGEAFISAGFSVKSAAAGAARLVKKSEVSARICELRAQKSEVSRIDAAWLLSYFAEILKSDVGDIIEKENVPPVLSVAIPPALPVVVQFGRTKGDYKPIHEWPLIWRQQLRGMDIEARKARSTDGVWPNWDTIASVTKIKYMSREKIAELAGMHIGVKAFEAPKQVIEHSSPEAEDLAQLFDPAELKELRDRILTRRAAHSRKP